MQLCTTSSDDVTIKLQHQWQSPPSRKMFSPVVYLSVSNRCTPQKTNISPEKWLSGSMNFPLKWSFFRGHVDIQGGNHFDLPGRGTVVTSMSCGLHCYSQWNLCSRMEFSSALMQPKNIQKPYNRTYRTVFLLADSSTKPFSFFWMHFKFCPFQMGKDLAANKFKQGPQQRLPLPAGKPSWMSWRHASYEWGRGLW